MNHHNQLCPIVVWGVRQLVGTYGQFLDKKPTFTYLAQRKRIFGRVIISKKKCLSSDGLCFAWIKIMCPITRLDQKTF